MEEKLAAFSYEVFDIIKNHKIIIEINSLRPLSDMKYEEIVQDVVSYLEFLDPIKIHGILTGHIGSFDTIQDAINILVEDFHTKEIKVKCKLPKRFNLHYDYFHLEETHDPQRKLIIALIGIGLFASYILIKTIFNL